jgi:hypothetical protein
MPEVKNGIRKRTAALIVAIAAAGSSALTAGLIEGSGYRERVQVEQGAAYQSYLFEWPSTFAQDLPASCGDPLAGKYEIDEYTQSVWSAGGIASLRNERRAAAWVPLSTASTFALRNLTTSKVNLVGLSFWGGKQDLRYAVSSNSAPLGYGRVRLSNAGFDRSFTVGMFYAEVSCNGTTGREYVYIARDSKHGNRWYVVRADRE